MMEEKLIGQAKREMLGNDLYWDFIKLDWNMPDHFIRLKWIATTTTPGGQSGRRAPRSKSSVDASSASTMQIATSMSW